MRSKLSGLLAFRMEARMNRSVLGHPLMGIKIMVKLFNCVRRGCGLLPDWRSGLGLGWHLDFGFRSDGRGWFWLGRIGGS